MTDSPRTGDTGGWPFTAAPLIDGWLEMSRAWMEASGRCGARLIGFVGQRLEADLEHGRKLAECRDLRTLGELQTEWLRRTFEDYRRELQALSEEMWSTLAAVRERAASASPSGGEAEAPRGRERRAA